MVYNLFVSRWFTPRTRLRLAWFCVGIHVLALLASLLLLANGMPPGDLVTRREFVASHPTLWAVGWAIWLPATLGLILFFMAWADGLTPSRVQGREGAGDLTAGARVSDETGTSLPLGGRGWAGSPVWGLLAIALTLAGGVVDWVDEITWIFLAPHWAVLARADVFYANLYAVWDRAYAVLSLGLANFGYTLGGIILNGLAYRTPGYPRWLARLGAVVWSLSLVLSYEGWSGDGLGVMLTIAAVFATFLPWLLLVGYGWLIGQS